MDADELSELKYTELQTLAKKHGIRANGGKEYLVQQLVAYFEERAPASSSRITRPNSRSLKTRRLKTEISMEDQSVGDDAAPPDVPAARRTRSGLHSNAAANLNIAPAASVQRTRSRVISGVAPRAALTRTSSQSRPKLALALDSSTDQESSTANPTPPPPLLSRKKALDTQRRLGVGRPKAIGGSGVRKSTARTKSASIKPSSGVIVEVVVPTLQAVREEEAAAASRASAVKPMASTQTFFSALNTFHDLIAPPADSIELEDEEEDERRSTPPPQLLRTKPGIPQASPRRLPDTSLVARLSALEDRVEKTSSALETERRRVAVLYARVCKLEAENRRMQDDLDAVQDQNDSSAEKQIVSETPQTPSSRLSSTPPPIEKENEQPGEAVLKVPPPDQAPPSAIQSLQNTVSQVARIDLPAQQSAGAGPSKIIRPAAFNSRTHSPLPPTQSPAKVTWTRGQAAPNHIAAFGNSAVGQSTEKKPQTVIRPHQKTLGKHPRDAQDSSEMVDENGGTSISTNHSHKKRRRMDPEQRPEGGAIDIDMDGEPVNVDEDPADTAGGLLPPIGQTTSGRASSQPARSARPSSARVSVEPAAASQRRRRNRAGSAAPAFTRPNPRASTATHELNTVLEGDSGETVAGPSTTSTLHPISLAPIDPLPLPRMHDASLPPFVTYPLPGDPVKELKPLTHFDSGTEFFGTQSKQNYRTDWHEGTVFDDPFDAETVRRAQGIAAEEVQGGFGPQGLEGIVDGLEERDEQESLGVRGMMSFAGESEAGVDLNGGL